MTQKDKKANIATVVERLKQVYPSAVCALEFDNDPWKLLVMGRLSAQCTDNRVNIVCKDLFKVFPTAESMAYGELAKIEELVKPCGLFRTKAKNLQDSSKMLIEDYNGILPNTMEELLKFPGVGRKIANLLLGDIYNIPSIVADTHMIRICGRLGMYCENNKDPKKVEMTMSKLVLPAEQSSLCHRVVQFGRDTCTARSPKCKDCPLNDICLHNTANK